MATASKKSFKPLMVKDIAKEKIFNLNDQLGQARHDYEDMKKNREETKKQLESKFLEIHKRLDNLKQNMKIEATRIKNSLKAFSSKFENQMNDLRNRFRAVKQRQSDAVRKRLNKNQNSIAELTKLIKEEREERMKEANDKFLPLEEKARDIVSFQEKEMEIEKSHNKKILRSLDDNAFDLNEKLDHEADIRKTEITILKEEYKQNLADKDDQYCDLKTELTDGLKVIKEVIKKEMDKRFDHQDGIIDSLSNFLKTFQDTLHVIEKEGS